MTSAEGILIEIKLILGSVYIELKLSECSIKSF